MFPPPSIILYLVVVLTMIPFTTSIKGVNPHEVEIQSFKRGTGAKLHRSANDAGVPKFIQPKQNRVPQSSQLTDDNGGGPTEQSDNGEVDIGYNKSPDPNKVVTKDPNGINAGQEIIIGYPNKNRTKPSDEIIIGYPPKTTRKPSNGTMDPALQYFLDNYLNQNQTAKERTEATIRWFNSAETFENFLKLLYSLSTYEKMAWRGYGEPCVVPAEKLHLEIEQENATSNAESWKTFTDEREKLALKAVDIIDRAYTNSLVADDFNYTIHQMLVSFRTNKTVKIVHTLYEKLKNLQGFVSTRCNPLKYLSCNPYFSGDWSSMNESFAPKKPYRLAEATPGNCDCRPTFTHVEGRCYVKEYEDCNLINLLNEYEYKPLPPDMVIRVRKPTCVSSLQCLNDLVCFSKAHDFFITFTIKILYFVPICYYFNYGYP